MNKRTNTYSYFKHLLSMQSTSPFRATSCRRGSVRPKLSGPTEKTSYTRRVSSLQNIGLACVLFCCSKAAAQTSVFDASYDTNGNLASGTNATLNPFIVTGFYTGNSTTTETVFIADSTANGRIFGSTSLFAGMVVGGQYTASITTSVYQGTQEFKTPTGIAATGMLTSVTPTAVTLSKISSTAPIAGSPSDSNYTATGSLLFAPISFQLTPTTGGTLSTSTSTTITDTATGLAVLFYRAATAFTYTAGTTYNVTGYEQPFNGNSEVVGVTSFTAAVPEPSSCVLAGLGGLLLMYGSRRTLRPIAVIGSQD